MRTSARYRSQTIVTSTLLLWAAAAPASNEQEFNFDIPRAPRARAVKAISQQSHFSIGYDSNDDRQAQTLIDPIKGRYTLDQAMKQALRSSPLEYRWIQRDMLSVTDPEPVTRATARTVQTVTASVEPSEPEEIMVSVWPIPNNFSDIVAPVILDRNYIDSIGALSFADLFRSRSQSPFSRAEGYYASGAQYAEMRGLGPEATMILINGRRAFASANSIASSAFDLNSIPLSAIDHIEFVPNAGAAWYGAEGIGGTVNIVTRQPMTTPSISINYGGAAGGAELRGVTLAFGTVGERLNSAFVVDYLELGGLLGQARSLWSNQDYRRLGGQDLRLPISEFGNIYSTGSWNLPGLSYPMAAVPLTDSTPGISREDFLATAGMVRYESLLRYQSIVPESTRFSVVGTISYPLTDRILASFELLYADRSVTFHLPPPMLFGAFVPASNPYNPFGVGVLTNRLLLDAGQQYQYLETEWLRVGSTLHGSWSNDWHWEVSAVHSQEQASVVIENELDFGANGAAGRALASTDPSTALNPFQSGPIGSPALLASLFAPRDPDEFGSSGQQVIAFLQGKLLTWPAGPVVAKFGGEWRRETSLFDTDPERRFDVDREITSAFLQLSVPLLKELPIVDRLLLTADARLDRYDGMAQATHSQVGLQWCPRSSLTVRASWGGTFRPPSLYETNLPALETPTRVNDPVSGQAVYVPVITGGNRDLQSSEARSWSAGLAFSPENAMNWTVSVDYWRIAVDRLIASLPPDTVLANEASFPGRVVRAESTGTLLRVDSTRINTGSLEARGVDLAIGADFMTDRFGRFKPQLSATWIDRFESAQIPGQSSENRVNVKSELGSILELRAILSLQWQLGPYRLTSLARFSPSYDDAFAGEPTGGKIHSQTLFDLHGSFDFGSKSRLRGGVINVTDAEPGFSQAGSAFDYSQVDLKGRTYYLRLEKDF